VTGPITAGSTRLPDVLAELGNAPVWFRMVLKQSENGAYNVHRLLVEVNLDATALPRRSPFRYDYGRVVALSGGAPGGTVAGWLRQGSGEALVRRIMPHDSPYQITLPFAPNPETMLVSWRLYPSRSRYGDTILPRPFTEYSFTTSVVWPYNESGFFLADDCPFFPTFQDLVSELVYGVQEGHPALNFLGQEGVEMRVYHAESWIDRVQIGPAEVVVTARGTDLSGTRAQVRGVPDLKANLPLSPMPCGIPQDPYQEAVATLPTPAGVPPVLWLVLSRGNKCLDFRQLDARWSPFRVNTDGVEVEPPDLATQVKEFVAQGEGPAIEFKQEPPENPDQKDRVLKTVAAFANGAGGVILLGVGDDTGDIVGISGQRKAGRTVNQEKDRLTDMIRRIVTPEPNCRVEHCEVDGKAVILIYVERGSLPPYGIHPDKPIYYVRRGATSFPARPEEVRALLTGWRQLSAGLGS